MIHKIDFSTALLTARPQYRCNCGFTGEMQECTAHLTKMQNYEKIDDAEIMISASGTATWLAEMANKLKEVAEYLNDKDLLAAYEMMRDKIRYYSGVLEENNSILDEAISKF